MIKKIILSILLIGFSVTTVFAAEALDPTSPGYVSISKGGTGAGTAGGALTNLGAQPAGSYVPQSATVNGHPLSANVTVSATDITTGTLPHAQLPALIGGDIPANTANTSGTAANLSGTPALPNGTTATTQTTGDNTAKVATNSFVNASIAAAPGFYQGASYQYWADAPTPPSSTSSFTMQGLGALITPSKSGCVLIIISGDVIAASGGGTAGYGIQYKMMFGTGTPPTNGAALTGTLVATGGPQQYKNPSTVTSADLCQPFSIQSVRIGLTLGTTYWIDIAALSLGAASKIGFDNIIMSIIEF